MAGRPPVERFKVERWDTVPAPRRVDRRRVAAIAAVAVGTVVVAVVLLAGMHHSDSATFTLQGRVDRISVDADAGSVRLVGRAVPDVRIVRSRHSMIGAPSATTQWLSNGLLRVVGLCPGGLVLSCKTDFVIEAPASAIVEVNTRSARVSVEGMTGSVEVASASGAISLRKLGGKSLVASTKHGAVSAVGVAATQVDVDAHHDVTLVLDNVADDVRVVTDYGAVDITVPNAAYQVKTDSAIGVVHVDVTKTNNARRSIDVTAPRGDIRVHPSA